MNATENPAQRSCDTGALNALLRGELSAVETYDQAMRRLDDHTVLIDLRQIREEHAASVAVLRQAVVRFGGEPTESSGPWGTFASAVTGAAGVLGPATVLSALRQGEEHGINSYEDALTNPDVDHGCKDVIRAELLPRVRQHVDELNRLMGGMK